MDSIVHFENDRFVGRTNFSPSLLRSAITAAVSRVDGVAAIRSDHGFRFRNMWGRMRRGVAIKPVGYGTIAIEVCILARPGYTVADLSYRVQEAIHSIMHKDITSKKVRRVDVRICGIERAAAPQQLSIKESA